MALKTIKLTKVEQETLVHVACGKTLAEVATITFNSVDTVKSRLYKLRRKLGARTTLEAIMISLFHGAIDGKQIAAHYVKNS